MTRPIFFSPEKRQAVLDVQARIDAKFAEAGKLDAKAAQLQREADEGMARLTQQDYQKLLKEADVAEQSAKLVRARAAALAKEIDSARAEELKARRAILDAEADQRAVKYAETYNALAMALITFLQETCAVDRAIGQFNDDVAGTGIDGLDTIERRARRGNGIRAASLYDMVALPSFLDTGELRVPGSSSAPL